MKGFPESPSCPVYGAVRRFGGDRVMRLPWRSVVRAQPPTAVV